MFLVSAGTSSNIVRRGYAKPHALIDRQKLVQLGWHVFYPIYRILQTIYPACYKELEGKELVFFGRL